MLKRVKKLYSHGKKSKTESNSKHQIIPSLDCDSDIHNGDESLGIDTRIKSQSCANVHVSFGNNNVPSSNKKSKKQEQRKESIKDSVKGFSRSTNDLLRHHISSSSPGHLEHTKEKRRYSSASTSSRRHSLCTLETVRENRLTIISKLDEYIENVKKCDDSISYAPNRLCCAQLLRMVYQKREQQYRSDSLHSKKNVTLPGNGQTHLMTHSNSLSNLSRSRRHKAATTGSLQSIETSSTPHDTEQRLDGKGGMLPSRTDSESSSLSGGLDDEVEVEDCNVNIPRGSTISPGNEDVMNNNSHKVSGLTLNGDVKCDSSIAPYTYCYSDTRIF